MVSQWDFLPLVGRLLSQGDPAGWLPVLPGEHGEVGRPCPVMEPRSLWPRATLMFVPLML